MKKEVLLLMMLAFGMYSVNGNAQVKKTNIAKRTSTQTKAPVKTASQDSREYQVGKDGFEWYKICKNGKYGAEDRNGQLLIPCEYDAISYYDWLDIPGYFWVRSKKQGMGEGMYSRKGECVIPISRNYHSLTLRDWNREEVGAYFQYCTNSGEGNTGICNIRGEKVFEANCHYDDIKPYYRNGKFFYEVGICENAWRHGIIDGSGNIIIPLKYKEIGLNPKYFFDWESDAIIGNYNTIKTTKNMLADNIRLTASISSNSSVSNSQPSPSNNSNNSNSGNNPTTVVVEQHGPVQVWIPCGGCQFEPGRCSYCHGSGWGYNNRLCSRCGGNGKCTICGGNGGHYEVQYR